MTRVKECEQGTDTTSKVPATTLNSSVGFEISVTGVETPTASRNRIR